MSFTVEQCQEHLDAWLEADLAVTKGQSYNCKKYKDLARQITTSKEKKFRT